MQKIVLISGKTCTGKSGLAKGLEETFGYHLFQTSKFLRQKAIEQFRDVNRLGLQSLGDAMDVETNHSWVFDEILKISRNLPVNSPIVVDNLRNPEQLEYFRKYFAWKIIHVHLYAPSNILESRFQEITESTNERHPFYEANHLKNEEDVKGFKNDADVRINTDRSDEKDTLVRVAARLNLYSPPDIKCVDVIVGGQYGSEGKGNIAAYLANDYDILVRVGGPNAGHTVVSASGTFTYHQLPSGTRDTNGEILLGPGMTINVSKLLEEINQCSITHDRLFIDPQAMIIEEEDLMSEKVLVSQIGSTGQGGGAAAARRIMGRKQGGVRLAKDIPELELYVGKTDPYRGSTSVRLEKAYREGKSILLEGTQGSGLSLYHGIYPFVTSRDTNVAGCLAEAGISPSRIRRILMVVRSTPIRVADPTDTSCLEKVAEKVTSLFSGGIKSTSNSITSSGPLKHEITFEKIAEFANLDSNELTKNEKTSTTKRDRRVGWFDWELFRKSCSLNAPTDIVLTFADYIDSANQKAHRFEQLTTDTIKFIEELERIAQAPVSLINTRFPRNGEEKLDLRSVIDRRNWTAQKHSAF